ncbi:hypothetical protein [Bradyrhizobium amphicarpaeae]|uniref:Uncharacterized protein n=1 Tax=Bradyrhizobium amphicarpaeae TaxID=1404768 RepID=A0A2U8PXI5_9BRAD|nr:hypothetical protein [Bradyrhizobium amphicarpaeae]AWM02530.1 hypothetical protein CIT40_22510 [Bradyrhizobium amphicarpaeae]
MTHPLLTALAQARLRDAPIFVRWCELNGVTACPAAPALVARFVTDCAALGVSRLWSAVQDISRMHVSLGLADPTLGGAAASAMNAIAAIPPPRSWPAPFKQRFSALPYDIQIHLAAHEAQRERALRRAQNDAASARQKLAALEAETKDRESNGNEAATRDQD